MTDKSCMSYWLPRIMAAGLPIPRTHMLAMPPEAMRAVVQSFDGKPTGQAIEPFLKRLRQLAALIGYPCFLRTGHTAAKHYWRETCFLASPDGLAGHVMAIIEFSECAGIIGLPWNVWAVRELLPTVPMAHCAVYKDMPVCREFRFFVRDGEIICRHPYWPLDALERGGLDAATAADRYARLIEEPQDLARLEAIAAVAGKAVGGEWSVDLLETERGWYLTDMAEAAKSFHWEGCEKAG